MNKGIGDMSARDFLENMEGDKVLEKFEELEEAIKDANEYQRCPDYCKGCVQCKFWKNFDKLKTHFHGKESQDEN